MTNTHKEYRRKMRLGSRMIHWRDMHVTCAYKKECAAENGCIFPVKFFRGKHQRGTLCCLVAARIVVKQGISRTKGIGQCVLPSAWND